MDGRKASYLAVAVILVAVSGTAAGTVGSQDRIDNVIIRGEGTCAVPTGHAFYALNWVVINPEANGQIRITSATESGAHEGDVGVRPNPLSGGETGKAGDGPVAGDTEGTVTLTVDYVTSGGEKGRSSGSLFLEGNCQLPDRGSAPGTGPSRVDAPRPTRVDER